MYATSVLFIYTDLKRLVIVVTLIKNNKERAHISQDCELPMNMEICKRWIITAYSHQYDPWAQQILENEQDYFVL